MIVNSVIFYVKHWQNQVNSISVWVTVPIQKLYCVIISSARPDILAYPLRPSSIQASKIIWEGVWHRHPTVVPELEETKILAHAKPHFHFSLFTHPDVPPLAYLEENGNIFIPFYVLLYYAYYSIPYSTYYYIHKTRLACIHVHISRHIKIKFYEFVQCAN